MMKKLLLGTVALAALSTTALAADLPSRRVAPVYVPPIPVFTWTGFYVGGDIGFAFGRERLNGTAAAAGSRFAQPNGIQGGGHVGYNFSTQSLPILGGLASGFGPGLLGGGLVVGIEADISGLDYRTNRAAVAGASVASTMRNDIQGSARGRLGIAVDRALFYATGGAAFAQFQTDYAFAPAAGGSLARSNTRVGYTVGGGMEYAITTQWSLRAQYLYSDFGTYRDALGGANRFVTRREIIQRAQVGFSYKFDTPAVAPVVARY